MLKLEFILENETHKIPWHFEVQTDHLILARRPDLVMINKKKRICLTVDFAIPADDRENIKRDKYSNFASELKKVWNIKVTVTLIIICVLETVPKDLVRGLEKLKIGGQTETIQTTSLLRLVRILRIVLET